MNHLSLSLAAAPKKKKDAAAKNPSEKEKNWLENRLEERKSFLFLSFLLPDKALASVTGPSERFRVDQCRCCWIGALSQLLLVIRNCLSLC
jgi:hypothetical protein